MKYLIASIKITIVTMLICVVAYTGVVLAIAQTLFPNQADGSLVRDDEGHIVGSLQVAQNFTDARHFWPRPSAVDFDGSGAGGSNLSPRNPAIHDRAMEIAASHGANEGSLLPPDLVTASGSGLDPHITEKGALFQVRRVAAARQLSEAVVADLVKDNAKSVAGPFAPERIVNVLEINLALNALD